MSRNGEFDACGFFISFVIISIQLLVGPSGTAKRQAAQRLCRIHDDKFAVVRPQIRSSAFTINVESNTNQTWHG